MKLSLKPIVCTILLTNLLFSCIEIENTPDDTLIYSESALSRFENFLSSEGPNLESRLGDFKRTNLKSSAIQDKTSNTLSEEEAKELLAPLKDESLILLRESGFTDHELTAEFGSLDEPEIIMTAFIVLEEGRNEYLNSKGIVGPKSDNNILKCISTALGMDAIFNFPFNSLAKSKRLILKTVGKFVIRNLGWVGWALGIGEFIQCYWGDNSVFD